VLNLRYKTSFLRILTEVDSLQCEQCMTVRCVSVVQEDYTTFITSQNLDYQMFTIR